MQRQLEPGQCVHLTNFPAARPPHSVDASPAGSHDSYMDDDQSVCIHRISVAICLSMFILWICFAMELMVETHDLCTEHDSPGFLCSVTRSKLVKMFLIDVNARL